MFPDCIPLIPTCFLWLEQRWALQVEGPQNSILDFFYLKSLGNCALLGCACNFNYTFLGHVTEPGHYRHCWFRLRFSCRTCLCQRGVQQFFLRRRHVHTRARTHKGFGGRCVSDWVRQMEPSHRHDSAQMLSVKISLTLRSGKGTDECGLPWSPWTLLSLPFSTEFLPHMFQCRWVWAPLRLQRFRHGGLRTRIRERLVGLRYQWDTVGLTFFCRVFP